nr:class I adenylate-forming enzyme family protein [uncultured Lachnoclostridium sp.]
MKMEKHLEYPNSSLYDFVASRAVGHEKNYVLEYCSRKITYQEWSDAVTQCAKALTVMGVKKGEAVSVCLPNIPQAVILFYAINKIGAIVNMIHPLSAEAEISYYLSLSDSQIIFVSDKLEGKINLAGMPLKHIIFVSSEEYMPRQVKLRLRLSSGHKKEKMKSEQSWTYFMNLAHKCDVEPEYHGTGSDTAVILYSGGTTGKPKGILLTNMNFNALALQSIDACGCLERGDRVLAVMPLFHGFGLGVCIHTTFVLGGVAILLPRYNPETFLKNIVKQKVNVVASVPAIYENLLLQDKYKIQDLSFIKCIIAGGDSLSPSTKRKLDRILSEHGSRATVRVGYGLTESVTGCCLMPEGCTKFNSVGIPYADTYIKIINPVTEEEMPPGKSGEIVLRGPSVMKGYLGEKRETRLVLRRHADGEIWLHTGDLGYQDEEGYIYFRQRLKRMIVSNGYNIYPEMIENVINSCHDVFMCAVVGVPDKRRGERVKAFIVPKNLECNKTRLKLELLELCEKNIARYAIPKDFVFLEKLPLTVVGKIAYHKLITL